MQNLAAIQQKCDLLDIRQMLQSRVSLHLLAAAALLILTLWGPGLNGRADTWGYTALASTVYRNSPISSFINISEQLYFPDKEIEQTTLIYFSRISFRIFISFICHSDKAYDIENGFAKLDY